MEAVYALIPAILVLAVGIIAIVGMRQLGQSPIVGYMIGGMLIGPNSLGLIEDNRTTQLLAELGVVFLLFDIGLLFSLQHIWDARRDIFILGPIQIILCVLAFGGIALGLGLSFKIALVLGGALALSSTAVVIPTLSDHNQTHSRVGRTATAVLIFQDVFAIFLLVLASSMGGEPGAVPTGLPTAIGLAMLKSAIALGIALLLGRFAIRPLFAAISKTKNEEIFTAISLLIVLSMAAASGWAGLSLTLGAFLGGMMLTDTPFRHLIQTEAKPFRHLLLAFFFITIGMSLDWHVLLEFWWQILLFVIVLVSIKAVLATLAAKLVGWPTSGAMQLGFVLAQGSEFVFVILSMAAIRAVLGPRTISIVFIGVAISFALTSMITTLGSKLARLTKRSQSEEEPTVETAPATIAQILIFGMGKAGRTVADALEMHDIDYVGVESDHERFAAACIDGYKVVFGNPTDIRMAQTLTMTERSILVLTYAHFDVASGLAPIVQERFPNLTRIVAVQDDDESERFGSLGMMTVIEVPHYPGLQLAERVLELQGVDEAKIDCWRQRRDQDAGEE